MHVFGKAPAQDLLAATVLATALPFHTQILGNLIM